jgi:energy-coupling factor transport system ATP-binding protein
MALIYIENVSFYYLKDSPLERKALNNITLSIDKGEKIGIFGETGSGKSTLIQLFNGIIQPTEGTVYLKGKNIKEWSIKDICKTVGLVFQYPEHQFFEETVFEEVAFGPKNIGVKEDEIEQVVKRALQNVGLNYEEIKERSPFFLSGGEKRRLAIASVLAMDPEVLVLDEPTANLDPKGKREIMHYIGKWTNKNKTLVIVSHDLDEIIPLINRVIVLHQGNIIFDGSLDLLFKKRDSIIKMGLELPQILEIVDVLERKGYNVDGYITLNEMAEIIIAYKGFMASWKR